MSYANNKGADLPAHPRSLISTFVVHCLDSVMSLVSVTKISNLMLASVAEQADLSLTWSETPEDTFSHDGGHILLQGELIVTQVLCKWDTAKFTQMACYQQRLRSAFVSVTSDQCLLFALCAARDKLQNAATGLIRLHRCMSFLYQYLLEAFTEPNLCFFFSISQQNHFM